MQAHATHRKETRMENDMPLTEKQRIAEGWFQTLRDSICARFEQLEAEFGNEGTTSAAHFKQTHWQRQPDSSTKSEETASPSGTLQRDCAPRRSPCEHNKSAARSADEGGAGRQDAPRENTSGAGVMSVMKGRVFEKVGVNISTVHGEFSEQFRHEIPGASENPRFWASGISLVAHPANPHVPAAHMNTRMIVVGDGARLWFGGGGDLNPSHPYPEDTQAFHKAFRHTCDAAHPHFYPTFSEWCEDYFFLPHRNVSRGVGGIFYDYLGLATLGSDHTPVTSGRFGKGGLNAARTQAGMEVANHAPLSWQQAFAFTQSVGETFRDSYSAIVARRMRAPFTEAERHAQLVYRGRYAEYNLLYDRGTRFGLMTGGNTEAILMSLPPHAIWE